MTAERMVWFYDDTLGKMVRGTLTGEWESRYDAVLIEILDSSGWKRLVPYQRVADGDALIAEWGLE
jgi:hypothetical protein